MPNYVKKSREIKQFFIQGLDFVRSDLFMLWLFDIAGFNKWAASWGKSYKITFQTMGGVAQRHQRVVTLEK